MLSAKILNSSATLNDFDSIGSLQFIPGETIKLVMQLTQAQRSDALRYMTATGATLNVMLPNKDGTTLTKAMTVLTGDSSIWSVDLTASETEAMSNGNMQFDLTEGAVISKGWVQSATSIIITGAC